MLADLLARRYSCRGFRGDEVPRQTIVRILEAAQRTPSWCNAQPWAVAVASGAATERLRAAMCRAATTAPAPDIPFPREYRGVYRDRRRECGVQLYESVGVARGDDAAAHRQRMENFRFFGAPHVAIVSTDEALGPYGILDCGAYVNNFMLAARDEGIAAIAQAALGAYPAVLRVHLNIPEGRLVVCGISFGYEDERHPANAFRTRRAPLEDVVTWSDA